MGIPAQKYRPVGLLCRDTQNACPAGKLGSMQGFTSAMSLSAILHGHAWMEHAAHAHIHSPLDDVHKDLGPVACSHVEQSTARHVSSVGKDNAGESPIGVRCSP